MHKHLRFEMEPPGFCLRQPPPLPLSSKHALRTAHGVRHEKQCTWYSTHSRFCRCPKNSMSRSIWPTPSVASPRDCPSRENNDRDWLVLKKNVRLNRIGYVNNAQWQADGIVSCGEICRTRTGTNVNRLVGVGILWVNVFSRHLAYMCPRAPALGTVSCVGTLPNEKRNERNGLDTAVAGICAKM